MKRLLSALLFGMALAASGQTVTVTGSHLGADLPVNGTITFAPVAADGVTPISARLGSSTGATLVRTPRVASVTNGAFTLTNVPDTSLTIPKNICFAVTVRSNNGLQMLGPGYSCVQPAANNSWCTSGVCNFDLLAPNLPALPTQGITLAIGTVTTGTTPAATITGGPYSYLLNLVLPAGSSSGGGGGGSTGTSISLADTSTGTNYTVTVTAASASPGLNAVERIVLSAGGTGGAAGLVLTDASTGSPVTLSVANGRLVTTAGGTGGVASVTLTDSSTSHNWTFTINSGRETLN
jgi:hypothetical protein